LGTGAACPDVVEVIMSLPLDPKPKREKAIWRGKLWMA
jgi:hypothetical protein